jgi:circadian clock protein KaiB
VLPNGQPARWQGHTGFVGDARRSAPDKAICVPDLLLRLYIAGHSATSRRAEQNLLRLQGVAELDDKIEVEIIDVLQNPELAEQAAIIATPTLAYEHPVRPRRIIGDLSDVQRVLEFLGIESERDPA